jgi:hypothetical protein
MAEGTQATGRDIPVLNEEQEKELLGLTRLFLKRDNGGKGQEDNILLQSIIGQLSNGTENINFALSYNPLLIGVEREKDGLNEATREALYNINKFIQEVNRITGKRVTFTLLFDSSDRLDDINFGTPENKQNYIEGINAIFKYLKGHGYTSSENTQIRTWDVVGNGFYGPNITATDTFLTQAKIERNFSQALERLEYLFNHPESFKRIKQYELELHTIEKNPRQKTLERDAEWYGKFFPEIVKARATEIIKNGAVTAVEREKLAKKKAALELAKNEKISQDLYSELQKAVFLNGKSIRLSPHFYPNTETRKIGFDFFPGNRQKAIAQREPWTGTFVEFKEDSKIAVISPFDLFREDTFLKSIFSKIEVRYQYTLIIDILRSKAVSNLQKVNALNVYQELNPNIDINQFLNSELIKLQANVKERELIETLEKSSNVKKIEKFIENYRKFKPIVENWSEAVKEIVILFKGKILKNQLENPNLATKLKEEAGISYLELSLKLNITKDKWFKDLNTQIEIFDAEKILLCKLEDPNLDIEAKKEAISRFEVFRVNEKGESERDRSSWSKTLTNLVSKIENPDQVRQRGAKGRKPGQNPPALQEEVNQPPVSKVNLSQLIKLNDESIIPEVQRPATAQAPASQTTAQAPALQTTAQAQNLGQRLVGATGEELFQPRGQFLSPELRQNGA